MPDQFDPASPVEFSRLLDWMGPEAAVKFLASLSPRQLEQVIEPMNALSSEEVGELLQRLGVSPLIQLINLLNPPNDLESSVALQEVAELEQSKRRRIFREPAEMSDDLYPGLTVHDDVVSGSINIGYSRLSLWAINGVLFESGWKAAVDSFGMQDMEWTQQEMSDFVYHLLQARGEFGRLLLTLANAHKIQEGSPIAWWQNEELCEQVRYHLRRCLDSLEEREE